MKFTEEKKKIYSSGTLLKKHSCKNKTIIVEDLDSETAGRINDKVQLTAKENIIELHNSIEIAKKTYIK